MIIPPHWLRLQKPSPGSFFLTSFLPMISSPSSVKSCSPCTFTVTPPWALPPDFMASLFLWIVFLLLQTSGVDFSLIFCQRFLIYFISSLHTTSVAPLCQCALQKSTFLPDFPLPSPNGRCRLWPFLLNVSV